MLRGSTHLLTPRTMFEKLSPGKIESPPPILRLPPELLQEIYSYLPTDAQALLSLTCKTILYCVGAKSWEDPALCGRWHGDAYSTRWDSPRPIPHWLLTPETLVRVPFMQALAKDSPDLLYCTGCRVLHPNLPGPSAVRLKPKEKDNAPCLVAGGIVDWFPREGANRYTLLAAHVTKAMFIHTAALKDKTTLVAPDFLNANYTFTHSKTTQTITYTAHPIKRNLLLKHSHTFTSPLPLTADSVLAFAFNICPHLSTVGSKPSKTGFVLADGWSFIKPALKNSPLLTHAINTAFPAGKRVSEKAMKGRFRDPYAREESQMVLDRKPGDYWWCRSCPTKFRVTYTPATEQGSLTLDVYHDFGASSVVAMRTFWLLVRRGDNCELAGLSRTFPDFECEIEREEVDDKREDDGERSVLLAVRRLFS